MDITQFVYEPLDYQRAIGWGRSLGRCAYEVYERGWPRQCERKPTKEIEGYGFCTQHAKMVADRLGSEVVELIRV